MNTPSKSAAALASLLTLAVPAAGCNQTTQPLEPEANHVKKVGTPTFNPYATLKVALTKKASEASDKVVKTILFYILKYIHDDKHEQAVAAGMDPNGTTACIDTDRISGHIASELNKFGIILTQLTDTKDDDEAVKKATTNETDDLIHNVVRVMICEVTMPKQKPEGCMYFDRKRMKLVICLAKGTYEVTLNGYDMKTGASHYGLGMLLERSWDDIVNDPTGAKKASEDEWVDIEESDQDITEL